MAPSCWPASVAGSATTTDEMQSGQILETLSSRKLEVEAQSSHSEAGELLPDFMLAAVWKLLRKILWRVWSLK